jgi:hypothetical protein
MLCFLFYAIYRPMPLLIAWQHRSVRNTLSKPVICWFCMLLYIFYISLFRCSVMCISHVKWICTLYVYSILLIVEPILIPVYLKYEFSVKVYYLPPTNDHCNLQVCCSLTVILLRSHFMTYIKASCIVKPQNIKIQRTMIFFLLHYFVLYWDLRSTPTT